MNKKQLITIFIAIGILSAMLIFPPWQYRLHIGRGVKSVPGPYRFIFMGAPEVPITSKSDGDTYFNHYSQRFWQAEIDWVRLILPSIVVVLIASGLVLYYKGFSTVGYAEAEERGKLWKVDVTEAGLVTVVNFLINNKGKEIVLAGEKHIITGKEKLDVEIIAMNCCDPESFYKDISAYGEVKNFEFSSYRVSVPAEQIPKIDKIGDVAEIKFKPEAHDFWMKTIKQEDRK